MTGTAPPQVCETPQHFCSAAKEALRQARSIAELEALWVGNAPTIAQLRAVQPQLRTRAGTHYADLLESLYRGQRDALRTISAEAPAATAAPEVPPNPATEPTTLTGAPSATPPSRASEIEAESVKASATEAGLAPAIVIPRRVRDPDHLKHVASLPCLVCGRTPSHAHHLRFAQLRSLGSKPSDEWTVPLCPIHHRSLHDTGREEEWWQAKGIDAKAEAEKLWRNRHAPAAIVAAAALATNPAAGEMVREESPANLDPSGATRTTLTDTSAPQSPPTDDQGQPLTVNLRAANLAPGVTSV